MAIYYKSKINGIESQTKWFVKFCEIHGNQVMLDNDRVFYSFDGCIEVDGEDMVIYDKHPEYLRDVLNDVKMKDNES